MSGLSRQQHLRIAAVVVPFQLVGAALAWRDLRRRDAAGIRGPKNLWRGIVLLNPGNSLLYWLVGRR